MVVYGQVFFAVVAVSIKKRAINTINAEQNSLSHNEQRKFCQHPTASYQLPQMSLDNDNLEPDSFVKSFVIVKI